MHLVPSMCGVCLLLALRPAQEPEEEKNPPSEESKTEERRVGRVFEAYRRA
jgi:hypothetical protein